MTDTEKLRLMFVAGEASGDAHAASLARALREASPQTDFEFFGLTGERMRAGGVETIVRADDLAIIGLLEVARALPRFRRVFKELKQAALDRRPDAVVLVDFPEFNLPLARALHRRGVRVIYYISPQLWAWRSWRVRRVRRDVDLLLAILPFETAWYARRGVAQVEFVGHPLAGEVRPRFGRAEFCRRHRLDETQPLIALLPGSRHQELARHLPVMLDAARLILRTNESAQFVIPLASNRTSEETDAHIAAALDQNRDNGESFRQALHVVQGETLEALKAADVAAVTSGTATLEAALTETPLVVVYRTSALNWHTLGRLVSVEHYGLVNLIAEERIVPELMQGDFTAARLARELENLLDPQHNAATRQMLHEATQKLGAGGASERAAQAVLKAMRQWKD